MIHYVNYVTERLERLEVQTYTKHNEHYIITKHIVVVTDGTKTIMEKDLELLRL